MNLKDKFLDNITYDQAIFTNSLIYRKIKNLNNGYDIYMLTRLDDRFVWEKTNNYNMNNNVTTEEFNNLRFATEDTNRDKYLTIYRIYEGIAIDYMIYNSENILVWNNLNIPMDINNIQTKSLLDIPSHINLEKDFDDSFEMNFEPLCGWDNLLRREPLYDEELSDEINNISKGDKKVCFDDLKIDIPEIEYRIDPYDNELYSKEEFLEYYGGLIEWNNQEPKLVLRREQYYHFSRKFNHLSNRRFEYLFKKYEKTFI